jgi:hypothetical protein
MRKITTPAPVRFRSFAVLAAAVGFALVACGSGSTTTHDGAGSGGGTLLGFTPSNVDTATLDTNGVGDVQFAADETIETDRGGLLGSAGNYTYQEIPQASGPPLGVFVVNSFTITAGVTARVLGADALVIVALDTIRIDGSLLGNSMDPDKGPGATLQSDTGNVPGAGPGGGGPGSATTSAGGGGYCGAGGAGASLAGATDDALAGPAFGNAALVPLLPGSNGGSGGVSPGGNGGGAIQLVAAHGITVTGIVNVGGNGGEESGAYQLGFANNQQGSGGGSGGAILLEAPTVALSGTLAANGGAGGGNAQGSAATASATPAPGGPADASHAAGGDGSGGSTVAGVQGSAVAGSASGGGGGGAGRIRVDTTTGQATLGGIVSPSPTTSCVSVGTLL